MACLLLSGQSLRIDVAMLLEVLSMEQMGAMLKAYQPSQAFNSKWNFEPSPIMFPKQYTRLMLSSSLMAVNLALVT
jgi:hypothetical protein